MLDCSVVVVTLSSWKVLHPASSLGVLAACTISKCKALGSYCGSLIYVNLPDQLLSIEKCCEGTTRALNNSFTRSSIAFSALHLRVVASTSLAGY